MKQIDQLVGVSPFRVQVHSVSIYSFLSVRKVILIDSSTCSASL